MGGLWWSGGPQAVVVCFELALNIGYINWWACPVFNHHKDVSMHNHKWPTKDVLIIPRIQIKKRKKDKTSKDNYIYNYINYITTVSKKNQWKLLVGITSVNNQAKVYLMVNTKQT